MTGPAPLDHPDLARFCAALERRCASPDGAAAFLDEVGARGVVAVLAQCLSGSGDPAPGTRTRLAGLVVEAVASAGRSADLDAEGFAGQIGELLRTVDPERWLTTALVVEHLVTAGDLHDRFLDALLRSLPEDRFAPVGVTGSAAPSPVLALGSFLVPPPVGPTPRAAAERALARGSG